MGGAGEGGHVPHIAILRCDVEVAAHRDITSGIGDDRKVLAQPTQPGQLVLVVVRVEAPTIGDVHARDRHATTGGAEQPGVRIRLEPSGEAIHAEARTRAQEAAVLRARIRDLEYKTTTETLSRP